ncbi:hypothetical protein ACOSP7_026122 [Xanthoceras sorbifolium]
MTIMNQALLAKAGWRLMQPEIGPWGQILQSILRTTLLFLLVLGGISFLVQSLSIRGFKWRIENGSKVHFWTDNWVTGIGILKPHATIHLDGGRLAERVSWKRENAIFRNYPWFFLGMLLTGFSAFMLIEVVVRLINPFGGLLG